MEPYFFCSFKRKQLVFQKKIIYNKHDVTYGAIAQLGERYAGSVEVRGSIPLGSIPVNPYFYKGFFVFNKRIIRCPLLLILSQSRAVHL